MGTEVLNNQAHHNDVLFVWNKLREVDFLAKYQEWLTEEGLLKIEAWARDGLTDEQIAQNMGISTSTLYEWKKKHNEFSESLKRGKEVVDIQVENALLKRALGYKYEEVTQERAIDPKTGKSGLVVTKIVTKEVQPDTTAQIYWLKNRKPEQWRDKPAESTGNDGEHGVIVMPEIMEE